MKNTITFSVAKATWYELAFVCPFQIELVVHKILSPLLILKDLSP